MLKNYFKTAWRNLKRNKFYSLINFVGLSISLAFCALVMLYIYDEYSYDKFHKNGNQIYQVSKIQYLVDNPKLKEGLFEFSKNKDIQKTETHPMPLGVLIEDKLPEVELMSRSVVQSLNIMKEGKFYIEGALHVDPAFLDIFSFDFLYGDKKGALDSPTDIVISKEKALQFFGREDVVGEIIQLQTEGNNRLNVTGVIDMPKKSSIKINFLRNMDVCGFCQNTASTWESHLPKLFIQLKPNSSPQEVAAKVNIVTQEFTQPDREAWRLTKKLSEENPVFNYELTNIKDTYIQNNSNKLYRVVLIGLSLLIFLIATNNYIAINFSTAALRFSEIAVRRVVGANSKQLFIQFLGEAFLLIMLSLVFAITLVQGLLPLFNELTGKSIEGKIILQKEVIAGVIFMLFMLCLIAGGYVGLILSKRNVQQSLKSSSGSVKVNSKLIKGITLFQFMACVFLASIAFVMNRQFEYISEKDLGFDTKGILILDDTRGISAELKNELLKIPQVSGVALAGGAIQGNFTMIDNIGKHRAIKSMVDKDFIKVLNLKVALDLNADEGINEEQEALYLSKQLYDLIKTDSLISLNNINGMKVEGVMDDFHFASLMDPILPLVFQIERDLSSDWFGTAYIKYDVSKVKTRDVIDVIEGVWNRIAPDRFFEYKFMDEALDAQYKTQHRQAKTVNAAMTMVIILASIGLIGLVSIKVNNRVKEVGIRKVLGASISNIFGLLSREYLISVMVANILAIPIAYYVSKNWLETFEFHTNFSAWLFLFPMLFILTIGFVAILMLLLKAAKANPVDSLRNE